MFFIAPYYKGEESYNNMVLHMVSSINSIYPLVSDSRTL